MINEKPKIPEQKNVEWRTELLVDLHNHFDQKMTVEHIESEDKVRVGPVTIKGLDELSSLGFTAEQVKEIIDAILEFFQNYDYHLFERRDTDERDTKKERIISITFSNQVPKKWYEEYKEYRAVTADLDYASHRLNPAGPDLEEWIDSFSGAITIYPKNLLNKGEIVHSLFHELDHVLWLWEKGSFLDCFHKDYKNQPHERRAEKRAATWEKKLRKKLNLQN